MDSSSDQGNYPYDQEDRSTHQSDDGDVALLKTKYKEGTSKVYHDFYKTKMCNLYLLNICKKGKDCPFAHDEDEIREKPNLYKTKLCPSFLTNGYCKNGENCSFAHGEPELRSTPDLFKTAICNLWTQGKCNSGETCRFAHGYDDLRPAPSHHKFKKNNYNKAFHNNEQAQPRDQGHPGHPGHQGHQGHQGQHVQYTQPQPVYNHQAPYNQNMPYNQNVGYNQFYPQQPYPPNTFSFPMYPMGMQPTFQDPNMMGNFFYQNQGPQYQGHKK